MALVKLLKINSTTGRPRQHDSVTDELAMLSLQGGNIKLAGNVITSEDTNGDIQLNPNGTGQVNINGAYDLPNADGNDGQVLTTDGAGQVAFEDPSAFTVCNPYTADETLLAVDALYISAADNVSKADASAEATARVIGFAQTAASDTDPVNVCSEGVLGGFTGLTPGATYYLSETAGLITTTPPSTDDAAIVQVGYAKSATELHIHIEVIAELDDD